MPLTYKVYALNEAAVDSISADLQAYLNGLNVEKHNIQRIRLTVEEMLLNLLGQPDRCGEISVGLGKLAGRHMFRMRYRMKPFDPTRDMDAPWAEELMRSLGFFPAWNHRGSVNTVSLVVADRPKRSMLFYILTAVLAAAALGFAGTLLPAGLRQNLDEALLTPAAEGFLGLLRTFSGIMIVLTICSGILGMRDSASLGRAGKAVLLRYIGFSFAVSAASAVMALPFLRLHFTEAGPEETSTLIQISRMLFDILPTNIVDPFRTGNALQLIVIAALLGAGLLAMGEHGSRLRDLINDAGGWLQHTVSAICALVPVFVFVVLLRQFWNGQAQELLAVWKPLLLITGMILLLAAVLWLLTACRLRCSPGLLLKKTLPVFLVGFATASSMSAMPLGMETCKKKMGIREGLVSFAYPLGTVIYRPAGIIYFTVLAASLAEMYRIEVSPVWLAVAAGVSTLLIIALPPVPGNSLLGFSILFGSLGIPMDALILATAIDIIMDFIDTGFNVMLLIFRITAEAGRQGVLERKTLLQWEDGAGSGLS